MRKISIALACVAMSVVGHAQKSEEPQNVVKANPLGLLFGTANVAYERALNEKSSFLIAPTFGSFKLAGFKYSSFGAGAEYRFYVSKSKSAPAGFYAGPGIGFTSGKVSVSGDEENQDEMKFSSFGVKAIAGNQWIFKSGFTLDLNGGFSYQKFNYKDGASTWGMKGGGLLPSLGFSLGYAF